MIVDSLEEAVARSRRPVALPNPLPDAPHFTAQCTTGGDVVLRWSWDDGRHLVLGVVTADAVGGDVWRDHRVGDVLVRLCGPGDPRGGQRAYAVIDRWYVVAGGSLAPEELAQVVARCVLRGPAGRPLG